MPTRRVYAWGFISYRRDRSGQRIKTGNDEFKGRTRNPDVRSTRFIPAPDVRATRSRRPFPGSPASLGGGNKTQITARSATLRLDQKQGEGQYFQYVKEKITVLSGPGRAGRPPEKVMPCSRIHHQHSSHYWHSSSLIVRSVPCVPCQKVKFVGVRKTQPRSTLALKMPYIECSRVSSLSKARIFRHVSSVLCVI